MRPESAVVVGAVSPRAAQLADAPEMARLAGELGYPLRADEMAGLLGKLLAGSNHYVAVVGDAGRLLGWTHVEHRVSLEGGDRAEIMGLVVDPAARRGGIGRMLVAAAESWAAARGIAAITVRSNVARDLSHPFYETLGYLRRKTQHVYLKRL
jgi:GNAT superfamily N-acetyltransferase